MCLCEGSAAVSSKRGGSLSISGGMVCGEGKIRIYYRAVDLKRITSLPIQSVSPEEA